MISFHQTFLPFVSSITRSDVKFVHLLPSQNNPNLWRLVGTGPEQLVALAWPVRAYKPIEPKSSAQLLFQPTSTQWLSFNHKDYSTTLCSSQLAVTRVYKCIQSYTVYKKIKKSLQRLVTLGLPPPALSRITWWRSWQVSLHRRTGSRGRNEPGSLSCDEP